MARLTFVIGNIVYQKEELHIPFISTTKYVGSVIEKIKKAKDGNKLKMFIFSFDDGTFAYSGDAVRTVYCATIDDLRKLYYTPSLIELNNINLGKKSGQIKYNEINLLQVHPDMYKFLPINSEIKVKEYLYFLINKLGINFHPDNAFDDYLDDNGIIDLDGNKIDFNAISIKFIGDLTENCFDICGDQVYVMCQELLIGCNEMKYFLDSVQEKEILNKIDDMSIEESSLVIDSEKFENVRELVREALITKYDDIDENFDLHDLVDLCDTITTSLIEKYIYAGLGEIQFKDLIELTKNIKVDFDTNDRTNEWQEIENIVKEKYSQLNYEELDNVIIKILKYRISNNINLIITEKEVIPIEVVKILNDWNECYDKLNELWPDVNKDTRSVPINSPNYPFDISFDDLPFNDWINQFTNGNKISNKIKYLTFDEALKSFLDLYYQVWGAFETIEDDLNGTPSFDDFVFKISNNTPFKEGFIESEYMLKHWVESYLEIDYKIELPEKIQQAYFLVSKAFSGIAVKYYLEKEKVQDFEKKFLIKYPFNKSFDELTVIEWVLSVIGLKEFSWTDPGKFNIYLIIFKENLDIIDSYFQEQEASNLNGFAVDELLSKMFPEETYPFDGEPIDELMHAIKDWINTYLLNSNSTETLQDIINMFQKINNDVKGMDEYIPLTAENIDFYVEQLENMNTHEEYPIYSDEVIQQFKEWLLKQNNLKLPLKNDKVFLKSGIYNLSSGINKQIIFDKAFHVKITKVNPKNNTQFIGITEDKISILFNISNIQDNSNLNESCNLNEFVAEDKKKIKAQMKQQGIKYISGKFFDSNGKQTMKLVKIGNKYKFEPSKN
jgi:hypothetical protein